MKGMIYKLLPGSKQGLFALVLTVLAGTSYSQTTHTFNFTGGQQTITLQAGTFTIETWGADGGDNLGNGSTTYLQNGGKGGYSVGIYTLATATTIYVNVGGQGSSSTSSLNVTVPGGYNGGGYGSANATSGKSSGAGGGGATHVATATGTLGALASNTPAVIIVAGGGGGAGESNYASSNTQYNSNGGDGGGTSGLQNVTSGYQGRHGKGATQIAGGTGGDNGAAVAGIPLQGIFGAGGYNPTAGVNASAGGSGAGGGGGGWYGGGAGWVATGTSFQTGSGGGGSGYIGGVSNGTTVTFGQSGFATKPIVTRNGLVIIKEHCNISLSTTGTSANGAVCAGNSVTITTNAISNYSWSTGATTSSIVVTPNANTVYSLTATSPSNCTASALITVLVNTAVPTLSVANTASSTGGICPTKTVQLTANGALSYTWAGGTPVTNGVPFSPLTSSGYTVTGANGCGTSTAVTSISVHPFPTVLVSASSSSICSTQSVMLTASGNGTAYTWLPSTVQNTVAFYPFSTETYTAIGTSAMGCTNTAVFTVTVETTPTLPPLASPNEFCIGESTTLTAIGASNYSWMPGNHTSSVFVVSPNTTTTYTITKWNANCVDVQAITVTVNPLPTVFAFATPTVVCATRPATLAAGGANSFTWEPGPLPSGPTAANVVVFPQSNTVYTLTASDGKCVNSTTLSLNTNALPVITMAPSSTNICTGQTVNFNVTGADSYSFSNNPPTSPTLTGPSAGVTLTTTTSYVVTGTNNVTGCFSSAQEVILVNELPSIIASRSPTLVCAGFPSTLSAAGTLQRPAHTFTWTHTGTGSTSVVNPQTTSVYTVSGTDTLTKCMNTQTVLVSVFQPTFTTTTDTAICMKGSVNLKASGATQYVWEPGNISGVSSIIVSPTVSTVYTVSANSTTVGGMTCNSSQTIKVDIYNNPTITATSQRTMVCRNEAVELFAKGASTYTWINAGNQQDDTISVSPLQQTTYIVIGTDLFGCRDTATVMIEFSNCPGFAEHAGKLKVSVFPNPSTGEITIQGAENMSLDLINELGQIVRVVKLGDHNRHTVKLQGLAPGIYFLNGRQQNAIVTEKIVIQD